MADEGEVQYFAYGSNMSTAHTVAHCPSARAVTTATLLNYQLGFGRLSTGPLFVGGISTVAPEAGGTVEGVLFRVQRDELEAWDSDYAEDRYVRRTVQLLARRGAKGNDPYLTQAELYVPEPVEGPFPPAGNYLELMVAGAREHHLDDHADALLAGAFSPPPPPERPTAQAAAAGAPMRVLVCGAAGFAGRAVCAELLAAGHTVRAWDYAPNSWDTLTASDGPPPAEAELIYGDIADFDVAAAAVAGCEAVVHVTVSFSADERDTTPFLTNLKGLWNILENARLAGIRRVVHMGSAHVLFPGSSTLPEGHFQSAEVRRPDGSLYQV